jgi:hypothetical protein
MLTCLLVGGLVVELGMLLCAIMVPSCLLWCLLMERNYRNFGNREILLAELELFFFFTLYTWTAAFVAP